MWIDALVIIATPGLGEFERRILDAAMERRGWEKSGTEGYTISITQPESDQTVVKQVEQDVKQAVYVAGIEQYDAVCILSDGLSDYPSDSSLEMQDSDLNLGSF